MSTNQPPKPKRRWYQFSFMTEDAMERLKTCMLSIALLLVVVTPMYSAEPDDTQKAAIAAINKLGGRIDLDRNGAVVEVSLGYTKVTDADLENLKGLSNLHTLRLSKTNVTDAGLEHLKGLKSLRVLDFARTQVTNAGLEQLKGLSNLERLHLNGTQVTSP